MFATVLWQVSAKLRSCAGKPGETICRIAEEENAVVIVTGTRGMGTLRRTILGSVSDYLLKHAHCPVIVCRDPAEIERKRHASEEGDRKSRHSSGSATSSEKARHSSGDTFHSFASNLRQRFASGSKGSRSMSASVDKEELKDLMRFEQTIVLYPTEMDLTDVSPEAVEVF